MRYKRNLIAHVLTQRFVDSEIKNIRGAHFQISENCGIVTKSKQIPEANGRRACSLSRCQT